MFSITASSSSVDFAARKAAHFLSRLRREALVSASSGVSTTAHSANSHRHSFLDRVLMSSAAFMRFLNIDTRATESIFKIADNKGVSLELWVTRGLGLEFSAGSEALLPELIDKDGWSVELPTMERSWGQWKSTSLDSTLSKFSNFPWRIMFDWGPRDVLAWEPSRPDRAWD